MTGRTGDTDTDMMNAYADQVMRDVRDVVREGSLLKQATSYTSNVFSLIEKSKKDLVFSYEYASLGIHLPDNAPLPKTYVEEERLKTALTTTGTVIVLGTTVGIVGVDNSGNNTLELRQPVGSLWLTYGDIVRSENRLALLSNSSNKRVEAVIELAPEHADTSKASTYIHIYRIVEQNTDIAYNWEGSFELKYSIESNKELTREFNFNLLLETDKEEDAIERLLFCAWNSIAIKMFRGGSVDSSVLGTVMNSVRPRKQEGRLYAEVPAKGSKVSLSPKRLYVNEVISKDEDGGQFIHSRTRTPRQFA